MFFFTIFKEESETSILLAGDLVGNVHVFDFFSPKMSIYDLKLKQLERPLKVDLIVIYFDLLINLNSSSINM